MAGLADLGGPKGGIPQESGTPRQTGLAGLEALGAVALEAPEVPDLPDDPVDRVRPNISLEPVNPFDDPVPTPEPLTPTQQRHSAVVEQLKLDVDEFDSTFTLLERTENRLGIGWTRKIANDTLNELTQLRSALVDLTGRGTLEAGNQALESLKSRAPFGKPFTDAELQAEVDRDASMLQRKIEKVELDYLAASDAVFNPTMRRGNQIIDIPTHPVMAALNNAQAMGDTDLVDKIAWTFLAETMAETALPSIPQAGPAQLLVPGGLAAGGKLIFGSTSVARAGFVVGTGFVSGSVESAAAFSEYLSEHDVDVTDIDQVTRAITDPEVVAAARSFARKRGISVGVMDMLGAYLSARMLVPPQLTGKIARQITNAGAQLIQNPLTGAGGEALAQLTSGQEFNSLEVKLELLGEIPSAVSEPIIFHLADKLNKKPSDLILIKQVMEEFVKNPAMTEGEALAQMKDIATKGMTDAEAIDLVNSLPGAYIDPSILENTGHEERGSGRQASLTTIQETQIALQGFMDLDGNMVSGEAVVKEEPENGGGKVYWRVENDATPAGLAAMDEAILFKQDELSMAQVEGAATSKINRLSNELEAVKERKAKIEIATREMNELRPALHRLYQEMVSLFTPNANLLILENDLDSEATRGTGYGSNASFHSEDGRRTGVIYLSTTALLDMRKAFMKQGRGKTKRKGPRMLRSVLGVAIHEFGHNIMQHYADTLPPEVLGALKAEHRNWLAQQIKILKKDKDTGIFDILISKQNPNDFFDLSRFLRTNDFEFLRSKVPYNLSLLEWIADSMSRSSSDKKTSVLPPMMRKHMPRLQTIMERFYDRFRSGLGDNSTFDTFLIYIQARAQREARENLAAQFSKVEQQLPAGSQGEVLMAMMDAKGIDVPSELKDQLESNLDTYNKTIRYMLTILQLGKENKHISGLQNYIKAVHEHWITKSNWNDMAMQSMNAWRKLGRKQADLVGRYLLEQTVKSDDLGRSLNNDEIKALLKEKNLNLSPEAWEVVTRIQEDLKNALEELYMLEKTRLNAEYIDAQTLLKGKIVQLDKLFDELRNRDYFPLSRFGEFGIAMKATKTIVIKGKTYAPGDTVHFELYENKRQRNRGEGTLRRKFGPSVKTHFINLTEPLKPFTGMPMAIMSSLKDNPKLGLDAEQRKELQGMIDVMNPTQGIAKRMLERKGTEGFHLDAARGYANYMMQMGGHIAKMRHVGQMDDAIDSVRRSAKYLGSQGILNDKRHEIVNHLIRHQDYIMRPENEWGNMRAWAFHWFLGFNVKSAIVNLTQVPLVAYPYLAARTVLTGKLPGKSDAIASAALIKAGVDVANVFKKKGFKYTPEVSEMLDVLLAEGIIDESLATEIAGQAHGDLITKHMPGQNRFTDAGRQGLTSFLKYSTVMFQAAEKYNRRVVAVATFRLARAAGMDMNESITEAREALRATQFEYARWNRAAFMRGKAGVLFVFMQYLQNVLYFVAREPGKGRYVMLLLLAAGLQGLPGAEDLMDIFDFANREWKKWTGYPDPRSDVREDLRALIIELGASPELLMHGLSAQSFGLSIPAVSDMLGTSFPGLSFEPSISAGRIMPGLEALLSPNRLSGAGAVAGAKDVLGAAITIPINMLRWTRDTDPDQIRALERMAPSVLKGGLRAYRIVKGVNPETGIGTLYSRSGDKLVDFDMNNTTHIGELIGMTLGANPTRVQFAQEKNFAEREALQFYQEMRSNLQTAFNYAHDQRRFQGDSSGVKPTMDAIREFNAVAPKGQQLMNPARGYMQHAKDNALHRKNLSSRMFDTPFIREQQKTFPRATEEQSKIYPGVTQSEERIR